MLSGEFCVKCCICVEWSARAHLRSFTSTKATSRRRCYKPKDDGVAASVVEGIPSGCRSKQIVAGDDSRYKECLRCTKKRKINPFLII